MRGFLSACVIALTILFVGCEKQEEPKTVSVTSISLDKASVCLTVGETMSLVATVLPGDATDKTVIWSTSDASVATVNGGVVTAVKVGNATITAMSGDKLATCTIKVEPTPVTSVSLDRTSATLKAGETVTLTATVKPDDATDKNVIWSSSDQSVVTVSSGEIKALKEGKASITVTTEDGGHTATCGITVIAAIPGSHEGIYEGDI